MVITRSLNYYIYIYIYINFVPQQLKELRPSHTKLTKVSKKVRQKEKGLQMMDSWFHLRIVHAVYAHITTSTTNATTSTTILIDISTYTPRVYLTIKWHPSKPKTKIRIHFLLVDVTLLFRFPFLFFSFKYCQLYFMNTIRWLIVWLIVQSIINSCLLINNKTIHYIVILFFLNKFHFNPLFMFIKSELNLNNENRGGWGGETEKE